MCEAGIPPTVAQPGGEFGNGKGARVGRGAQRVERSNVVIPRQGTN